MPENDTDRMIENAVELSISQGLIHKGDFMIVTAGIPAGTRGSTNMVKVHIPGCVFLRGVGTGAGKEVDGTALILKKQGYSDIQLILSEKAKSDKIILISQWIPASFVEKLKDHISGFASEDGNIPSVLSDTLIRASIPSVLGVSGLLKNIKDGDRIRLDTKRGIILFK
jgi:pyruvate kinase